MFHLVVVCLLLVDDINQVDDMSSYTSSYRLLPKQTARLVSSQAGSSSNTVLYTGLGLTLIGGFVVSVLSSSPQYTIQLSSVYYPALLSILSSSPQYTIQLSSVYYPALLSILSSSPQCTIQLSSVYYPALLSILSSFPQYTIQLSSVYYPAFLSILSSFPQYTIQLSSVWCPSTTASGVMCKPCCPSL